jgi:hypothetical protein
MCRTVRILSLFPIFRIPSLSHYRYLDATNGIHPIHVQPLEFLPKLPITASLFLLVFTHPVDLSPSSFSLPNYPDTSRCFKAKTAAYPSNTPICIIITSVLYDILTTSSIQTHLFLGFTIISTIQPSRSWSSLHVF